MDMHNNPGMSETEHQDNTAPSREGWSKPQGVHIPEPTYMPVVMAVGMVCMLWGITTTYLITLVGLVLFVISVWGWIGELRHEHRHTGVR
ncbi:MAG: hypothetical protein WB819_12575 [Terriglobia bacterium]|jgi:hypothetical protein